MTQFPPSKLQYKLAVVDIQKDRQSKIALWRACFMVGCVVGLGLLTTSSFWKIKDGSQIQIRGNKLVGQQTINDVLDLNYPQLIWTIGVKNLTQKVESIPSVEMANINRQIIPPKIVVSVQERELKAISTSEGKMGFLDADGEWVAQEFYTNIDNSFNSEEKKNKSSSNFALPKLIVHNYQSRYKKSWIDLYQLISLYPELKINQVQWNQSGSLFLQTKIGKIALGRNPSRLEKQFEIMLKLQNLGDRVDQDKIAYIDLSNPDVNLIQKY